MASFHPWIENFGVYARIVWRDVEECRLRYDAWEIEMAGLRYWVAGSDTGALSRLEMGVCNILSFSLSRCIAFTSRGRRG